MSITILGIESSCDDTSAAVIRDGKILSNVIAGQAVHRKYGGVIPELASRAHQSNIVPVVDVALEDAGVDKNELSAIAFTQAPGLLGSLLVGTSFAKGLALSLGIPIIAVNHLQAHILSLFVREKTDDMPLPEIPFLCLLVSGGHTQIMRVDSPLKMEVLGKTIDDAAGEAFDKCAKVMGLPYPGGPEIDKLAQDGNSDSFRFAKPKIPDLNYSYSGFKTSFLYFLRDRMRENPDFIKQNLNDLAASAQQTIIAILMDKFVKAIEQTSIKNIGIAGGVAANSGLQAAIRRLAKERGLSAYIPQRKFTTDNAAMVAQTGYYKFLENDFSPIDIEPKARV
ncbi:MAG: tRNA (adenosine(37)-N6)-threonylcarbamoyltransferase complex transferase subunit TsaD [Bacteroidales bacterium]|nr:tRNA (adenosine(37)-N6)-threonylcarbamoyltransferase complex transferase subunit TsaD [Bacteroidales bacterium]